MVGSCLGARMVPPASATFSSASGGRYLDTGSASSTRPSSTSSMTAVEVMGLVMEAIEKIASVLSGSRLAGSRRPTASRWASLPARMMPTTAPGNCAASMSRRNASPMRRRRAEDRPTLSGSARGRAGRDMGQTSRVAVAATSIVCRGARGKTAAQRIGSQVR
jgi:hypothetical protein